MSCVGGAQFGLTNYMGAWDAYLEEAQRDTTATIHRALELGYNYFDTAPMATGCMTWRGARVLSGERKRGPRSAMPYSMGMLRSGRCPRHSGPIATASSRGQITLPVALGRKMGIQRQARLNIQAANDTIVIRPIRGFLELEGSLGKALPLEEERAAMPRQHPPMAMRTRQY